MFFGYIFEVQLMLFVVILFVIWIEQFLCVYGWYCEIGCMVNWYEDGVDSVVYYSDDDYGVDVLVVVVLVLLGVEWCMNFWCKVKMVLVVFVVFLNCCMVQFVYGLLFVMGEGV